MLDAEVQYESKRSTDNWRCQFKKFCTQPQAGQISSIPVALLTLRLLSCVSMKLTETEGMLNSVFSGIFSLIFWSSFELLNSFWSFSGF